MDVFLAQLPGEVSSLSQSIDLLDASEVRLRAHRIKGAAANASAYAVQKRARDLEMAAQTGDWQDITAKSEALCVQAEAFIRAIEEIVWIKHRTKTGGLSCAP